MASNDYQFITHWRVPGTIEEVATILNDPLDLPRWWPSVYLKVQELEPADQHGVGRVIDLYTKGWLPYTLRRLSFVLKPVFAANHRWAMARGEESLTIELARRREKTAAKRMQIPAPPGPASLSLGSLVVGLAAVAGTLMLLRRRLRWR
ncbi:MAG TPA: hypothetical protein VMW65_15580 [Chloroflexota bacterium]|nr:hypothetical protein [Chloroflexota bacterium]